LLIFPFTANRIVAYQIDLNGNLEHLKFQMYGQYHQM
jgi:hypothetical protein